MFHVKHLMLHLCMANSHLQTLEILEALSIAETDTATFCARFGVGPATIKRMIADARLYGAQVVSVKVGTRHFWRLDNWPQIAKTVTAWLALERARTYL